MLPSRIHCIFGEMSSQSSSASSGDSPNLTALTAVLLNSRNARSILLFVAASAPSMPDPSSVDMPSMTSVAAKHTLATVLSLPARGRDSVMPSAAASAKSLVRAVYCAGGGASDRSHD